MDRKDRPDNPEDCAKLVRRAQAGDDDAFDTLARRYRAAVLAITFSRTGSRDHAEDLAQDVMMKAKAKLPSLREPEGFPGWLKAIALNACRTWYRRSVNWPESLDALPEHRVAPPSSEPEPLQVLLSRERQRAWRRALISLPEANRLALLMHIWGEYSYAEIAAFACVPVTTVEGRIHRAKDQLRRLLRAPDAADLLGESLPRWRKGDE